MNGSSEEAFEREVESGHFRVVIFGSARLQPGSHDYKRIYRFAKKIGENGWDVVTGGGPGLMDAAMSGHFAGRRDNRAHEIGLQIRLPREQIDSRHFHVKKEFARFSDRLDTFMMLANVAVVAPGGVGTLLELLYTWQLIQVHHTVRIPIILMGDMWPEFVDWIKKWPLKQRLLDPQDVDLLYCAENDDQALEIIQQAYDEFKAGGNDLVTNVNKYRVQHD